MATMRTVAFLLAATFVTAQSQATNKKRERQVTKFIKLADDLYTGALKYNLLNFIQNNCFKIRAHSVSAYTSTIGRRNLYNRCMLTLDPAVEDKA